MPDLPAQLNLAPSAANAQSDISPTQQREFERARRSAMTLCPTFEPHYPPRRHDPIIVAETAERMRLLIATMGIARGGAGGLAVAALAHRGYFVQCSPMLGLWSPSVLPFDLPGVGGLSACLPTRNRPWQRTERLAVTIAAAALPKPRRIVSAHVAIQIRKELRFAGFTFDMPLREP